MTKPYMWVREYPASFDPQSGGEPASTDFSDVELPGYSPLYQDDLRDELVAALTGLLATHKPGRGQCCRAADAAIDALTHATT